MDSPKRKFNPFSGIKMIPFETPLVQFVDSILNRRIELGRPTTITNEEHWKLVEFIINGWRALYPDLANDFFKHMADVRNKANSLGISREGEAMIQHQLEVPQSLYALIQTVFPQQKWGKKFILKFAQRFKGFMGADKI